MRNISFMAHGIKTIRAEAVSLEAPGAGYLMLIIDEDIDNGKIDFFTDTQFELFERIAAEINVAMRDEREHTEVIPAIDP